MGSPNPSKRHHQPKYEDSSISIGSWSSSFTNYSSNSKKKWWSLMPVVVILVVIMEIAFLGRLDIAKKANFVNSWADSFYKFTMSSPPWLPASSTNFRIDVDEDDDAGDGGGGASRLKLEGMCEEWLEKADAVPHSRDFDKEPILVTGPGQEWKTCSVGCQYGVEHNNKPDASFGLPRKDDATTVHRSMESAQYYKTNDIAVARRRGYDVVMTTSLSSDVPVGYFSWAEYDIMAPLEPKTESALAAAFVSNCGARNFRLQALEGLEKANIKIDSYGRCHNNRNGRVDKVKTLMRYKFSLAFENSNEEDYVTEKFFQSLVAGTIPVVVGAPNIQDFAPSSGSLLHIKEPNDIDLVAKTMKYLSENPAAYNESLRWKFEGPSDSFKALVDMSAVHSSCRLCIFLATKIHEKEEKNIMEFQKRPCKCTRGSETVYHVYVRERGRFEMMSVFLRSSNMTLESLESTVLSAFTSRKHVPVWKEERPEKLRGGNELRVYRIYPLGSTQRQALYSFKFTDNTDLKNHIDSNPCAKLEVIFV